MNINDILIWLNFFDAINYILNILSFYHEYFLTVGLGYIFNFIGPYCGEIQWDWQFPRHGIYNF